MLEMDLSFDEIDDEGVKNLAEALKGNKTLLTFYFNYKSYKGAIAIAEALGINGNKTLTYLNLDMIKFDIIIFFVYISLLDINK